MAADVDAGDALRGPADADEEQRWAAHLVALLGDDACAVGYAMAHEIRAERTDRRAGGRILGDALPGRVHPAVGRGAGLDRLRAEDVRRLGQTARRRALH